MRACRCASLRTPTVDERDEVLHLLASLKEALPKLEALLERCSDHWGYEDPVYRFYHQSLKLYGLQGTSAEIVAALQCLAPERPLNEWFMKIVKEGTGKGFDLEHNRRWLEATRPILEAFFHARFFLEMAVRYGKELEKAPRSLPSGGLLFSSCTGSGS